MNVLVAGATGAIGRPLISALVSARHNVFGMTSSKLGLQTLKEDGAEGLLASALDAKAVDAAIKRARPEVVIDELTSLPKATALSNCGLGIGRVWSWVHVEDAAAATVAALECLAGVYNVVDDDPSVMSVWLPAFAASVGAPEPQHISEREAIEQAGPDAVYYATQLRGASNAKARRDLAFAPRRLEWVARTKPASRA